MTLQPDSFSNNAVSTLRVGISSSATSFLVQAGDGGLFPSAFPFSLQMGSELMKATGRSGDTLTVVRGQEGTAAVSHVAGETVSHSLTAGNLTNLWLASSLSYAAKALGVAGDGVADDTAALNAAFATAAGGELALSAGVYLVTGPISIPANTKARGAGRGATIIQPASSFSGASVFSLTSDLVTLCDLSISFASATTASNPTADGVRISGARYATLQNIEFKYLNGYAVTVMDSGSAAPFGAMLSKLHALHCAGGIHTLGASARGYGIQCWMSDLNLEIVDSLDALLIEDSADVQLMNINGAAGQGGTATNSMLHIKGASSSVMFANPDLGVYPGPASAPTILIEAGTNGSPSGVTFNGGVIQAGAPDLAISSGGDITFTGVTFKSASGDGVDISGLTASLAFNGCLFKTNNQSANATAYELNLTNSSNWVLLRDCIFESAVGGGVAGSVTHPINDTSHRSYVFDCFFNGAGNTPSAVFAGTPQLIRGCPGYNPRGSITPPTIGASPFSSNTSQNDVLIVFTALGGMTAFKIGGTSIGLPVANVGYHVPARQTLEVDWATTAPTWVWIAD